MRAAQHTTVRIELFCHGVDISRSEIQTHSFNKAEIERRIKAEVHAYKHYARRRGLPNWEIIVTMIPALRLDITKEEKKLLHKLSLKTENKQYARYLQARAMAKARSEFSNPYALVHPSDAGSSPYMEPGGQNSP